VGDLVLKTRVAVTKRNLRKVCDLSKTLEKRAAGLSEFLSLPDTLQSKVLDIQDEEYDTVLKRIRRFHGDDQQLLDGIKQLSDRLDEINVELTRHREEANQLRIELLQLLKLRNDIRDFLSKRAEATEKTLTEDNYVSTRAEIEDFFSEYVDLLRGVALRTAGFRDEDNQLANIFSIADQLPRLWGRVEGWEWQSLAVPSRQELNKRSQGLVLRVGFPEWTIWALPFVQHEFGYVFAERAKLTSASDPPYRSVLLADVLATRVTGPAYACAALLLRLDPVAVTAPDMEAALRSATIIVTLEQLAGGGAVAPVQRLTQRLRDEWRDAVATVGGDAAAFEAATGTASVAAATDNSSTLGLGHYGQRPLWLEHWAIISKWAKLLKADKADEIDFAEVPDSGDDRPTALAFLLNAAWLARVGVDPAQDAPEEALDGIARGAIQRMLQLVPESPVVPSTPPRANIR
jgi:hypothetical protein